MFGKVSFVAVLMILSAMVFASLKGPRVNDFVANGSDHSSNILPSRRPQRIPGIGETGSGMASLGDSSLPGAGGIAPPPATARPAPVAVARPQVAAPPDSSDQQMNNDDNSNDSDSNDNDNNDSSDDRNSNDDNSGDQAMNNQGGDEQSNNPFTQEVPPGMMRTPNGQLVPLITPPAIAPFPPRLRNN